VQRLREQVRELQARSERLEQAERTLAERDQELRTILEHAPFQILKLERDSTIVYMNRAAEGYEIGDVLGQKGSSFVPPERARDYRDALDAVFDRGETQRFEFQDLLGHEYESILVPVKHGELVDHAVSFAIDVTEQRRTGRRERELERQLHEAQKLESLGLLAGGIAHDFNNLLVGVLGNAELALRRTGPESASAEPLAGILESARRAADLCQQMLAYSGRGRFVVQPVSLSCVVDEMTQLLRASISKKARLSLRLAEDLPAVEADVTQLRQVVMNLLTNASDAVSESGGEILVSTERAHLDREVTMGAVPGATLPAGDYVRLRVSDTGRGMPQEVRARMFDPFFSSKATGRGLGLSAVQGIVRGHGGTIDVDSAPGRGTRITVLLPASEATARATHSSLPPAPDTARSGTILVVDDEPGVRTVAERTLEDFGFSVLSAKSGEDALSLFREHHADISAVLLDMTMPGMDGGQTLRALEEIDPDVRVALTSGYDEGSTADALGAPERVTFVPKPAPLETLLAALDRVRRPG
jgi:PAS domain S-box-containing protein